MNRANDTVNPYDHPDDLPAWRTPDDLAADELIDGILDADLGHRAGKPPPRPPVSADLTDSQRESVARILDGLELPDPPADDPPLSARYIPGGSFLFDEPAGTPAVWGTGDEVLWAEGEPLLLAGPPGVGKTTLTAQLVRARVGLDDAVLGYPVRPGRRVLYLAADRPRQIARALRRTFTDTDRAILDDRLVVWKGPPPADLARRPELLLLMASEADADTIVMDSLKDMATKLSDDDVGAAVNRAIQTVIAEGIEVLGLHHQRKGRDGSKPKTLEDLYGSTWIAAGAGSVILLWGAAGDAIVELIHLKQPASPVGPLKVEHDHTAGTTAVHRGFDPLAWLLHQPRGGTPRQAAQAATEKQDPTDNEVRTARRRLDALVDKGLARKEGGDRGGSGGTAAARYHATTHDPNT